MKNFIILLFFVAFIAPSIQTHVRSCSNGAPKPLAVVIGDCEGSPCRIRKGQDLFVALNFRNHHTTRTLRPEMKVKKFGFKINMDIPPFLRDACESIRNTQCPLEIQEEAIYAVNMTLSDYIPALNLEMEMTFVGDNDRPVTCFALDIQLY